MRTGEYNYLQYETLGNVRARIVQSVFQVRAARVLDVGTGNGLFAIAIARHCPAARTLGIDIVNTYVVDARRRAVDAEVDDRSRFARRNFLKGRFQPGVFDEVTFFLSICDLLRWATITAVVRKAASLIRSSGRLIICDGFPELAETEAEKLGFALHKELGYRYASKAEVVEALESAGLRIQQVESYVTGRPLLNRAGIRQFLRDECFYCTLDGSPIPNWEGILERYAIPIKRAGGAAIDSKITVIAARK